MLKQKLPKLNTKLFNSFLGNKFTEIKDDLDELKSFTAGDLALTTLEGARGVDF